jgi:hydrogenase maturation factor HypF (carbamoyltransferase family)
LRVKLNVTGIVQSVGFRPFIYRLATKNGLAGYVRNRRDAGVEILLKGTATSAEEIVSFVNGKVALYKAI